MIRYRMLEGGHPGAPEWASEWFTATDRLDDMHKVRQAVTLPVPTLGNTSGCVCKQVNDHFSQGRQ